VNLKAIVKVMNFHAIMRVDKANRQAMRYKTLEAEVLRMIDLIQNNRNLILDKRILNPSPNGPRLRIYIGSDMGFCGAVNTSVNAMLENETKKNTIIIIGKKIHSPVPVRLCMTRDEFDEHYEQVVEVIEEVIHSKKYSGIDICYDHFYNFSHIEPIMKTIFPMEIERDEFETYEEDFSIEGGDVGSLMEELLTTALNYEVKVAAVVSYASENVLREAATNESMKRIEEMEVQELWQHHKEINELASRKVTDSYLKTRHREAAKRK